MLKTKTVKLALIALVHEKRRYAFAAGMARQGDTNPTCVRALATYNELAEAIRDIERESHDRALKPAPIQ